MFLSPMLLNGMARLPMPVLYGLSWMLYALLYYVVRYRKTRVLANLQRAFPDKDRQEVCALAKLFYRNFCEFAVEVVKTPRMSGAELERQVELVNVEVLAPYIEAQQAVLLVGAHQANWEWVLLACARKLPFPLDSIYKPLGHAETDDFLYHARCRFGITPVAADQSVTQIIKKKRAMRGITMIADQNPERKEERYWSNFFGHETPFALGCEKIALMTRFPVIFTHRKRLARGRYQVRFSLLAEPPYERGANRVIESYVRELEASIAEQPENWLWIYDRWRHKRPLYSSANSSSASLDSR